jgi:two-component system CheB/CheR fusion protein
MKIRKIAKVTKVHGQPTTSSHSFPIVGIGASAGGLEAFIQVLAKIPKNTGLCFILIQHLDPAHPSLSVKIIANSIDLEVLEVENGMSIEPNKVFVMPPNHKMTISKGKLKLEPREQTIGTHLTIDLFLRSLADAKKNKAIGIVLSGTGSDGTNGLQAIKAEGGVTLAQNPQTAKFSGMPQHAIDAGAVDLVLSPTEITKELIRLAANLKRETAEVQTDVDSDSPINLKKKNIQREELKGILGLLRAFSNVDFSNYKFATVNRRIQRRMMICKCRDFAEYLYFLKTQPDEIEFLYQDMLINVTDFFRDPESYKILTQNIFPKIMKNRSPQQPIRIWVPGCSTGEEVYSIAIALIEFLQKLHLNFPIQIFATDISEECIQKARAGIYPESIKQHLTEAQLKQFFEKFEQGYKVRKALRDICLFSIHDVTQDPPFAKLDLVSCRNVLIYFAPLLQKRVIPIFHYALNPDGILWLGQSETPGEFSKLFIQQNKKHRFYIRANGPTPIKFHFPANIFSDEPTPYKKSSGSIFSNTNEKVQIPDYQIEAEHLILTKFTAPYVIVDADMEILRFGGRCAPFLEPPAKGSPSHNLFKMAQPELLSGLRLLVQYIKKENKFAKREGLHFEYDEKIKSVNIEACPINPLAPVKQRVYLIFFKEVSLKPDSKKTHSLKNKKFNAQQANELMSELADLKSTQQILIEQHETTQEELTSANEELQSANEELQSTIEELETAKEELQSTNEELITVNDELQVRNADLSNLGNDLSNLLASTEIPILMVSNDRLIRRFTPKAEIVFNLISSDIGRPLRDIKTNFNLDLDSLIIEVTESRKPKAVEIQDQQGQWRRLQIRPYKTIDNKIDGSVIAIIDIEELKQKEKLTKESLEYAISIIESVPLPLVVLDSNSSIRSMNPAFIKQFKLSDIDAGKNIFQYLSMHLDFKKGLLSLFLQTLTSGKAFNDFEFELEVAELGPRKVLLSGQKIFWIGTSQSAILLSLIDITDRRRIEEERQLWLIREQEARNDAEKANRTKDLFLATLSHELRTPLTSILTWSYLIRNGKVDFEQAKQGATVIEQSATAQSQLIDDLLDISRIIAGKLALDCRNVDLRNIIEKSIEGVRPLAAEKAITIQTLLPQTKSIIYGDEFRIQQILWNLLTNAIKFSPINTLVKVTLDYTEIKNKNYAQIKVIDQGKGITPKFLPHVFSRFSQADCTSTRAYGGLGLGLSIVKNLVNMQNGDVTAENVSEGTGCVFTLRFPLLTTENITDQPDAISSASARTLIKVETENQILCRLDGIRILFVEDDPSSREAISIYLKTLGAEVISADSAPSAMQSLPLVKPHIIVSDIAMPYEDGYSLIAKVRKLKIEQGSELPAIALTAFASTEDANTALKAGFNAHVAKPIGDDCLARAILKYANLSYPYT